MPLLEVDRLETRPQIQRAYAMLSIMAHTYVWGSGLDIAQVKRMAQLEHCATFEGGNSILPLVLTWALLHPLCVFLVHSRISRRSLAGCC
jgi:hypothetical protein